MTGTYVVVTPVRNEADFVGRTIASMVAQTVRPLRWVIVDDGSTDGTGVAVSEAVRSHPWMTAVSRPDRGFRKSGGGVVEAFYDGYAAIGEQDWDFIVKLDGDLSFAPEYFARCLSRFDAESRLGIGGGAILVERAGRLEEDAPGDPPFHVRGATKIYRRACWDRVHPLVRGPGWDTVDEVRANMCGWVTRTFRDIPLTQHRATGAVDGAWANWYKNGLANYITGYHPAFMLAKCAKRSLAWPPLVAATALWTGFCSGYVTRQRQVADPATTRYLRREQVRFLTGRSSIYRPGEAR